jgi:adenylate cyclase
MPSSVGRLRRLGRIRPYGMDTAIGVSELLPPADVEGSMSDDHIAHFEAAVDALAAGRWNESLELLGQLPVHDRTKDFLMIYIATNNYVPPPGWDGVVEMRAK